MGSALQKIDHYFTRKNKYFPHLLRRSLARVIFKNVDRALKKRFPNYEEHVFTEIPELDLSALNITKPYVVLAVGDPVYIQDYAKIIALSAARFSPDAAIHLHMIGENTESISALAALKNHPNLKARFTTSSEPITRANVDPYSLGRYCQCLRFARSWQFSEGINKPLIILDIDVAVIADLAPVLETLSNTDVGLIKYDQNFDPAIRINAGAVYLAPTSAARKFFRRASAHMLLHVLHGRFTEKLDQRCLSIAADYPSPELRLQGLPLSLVGKGDHPVIFTGKGKLKHTSLPQKFQSLGLE